VQRPLVLLTVHGIETGDPALKRAWLLRACGMICRVSRVVIGSYETRLQLSCAERDRHGIPTIIVAGIDGPGLSASVAAYDDRYGELAVFFEALANSWRGWEGERSFSSLEGQFEITARHDGHVRLAIRLRRVDGPGLWTLYSDVTVDPGEDMAAAARDVRTMIDAPSSP
jgi:hypothetical protein